MRRDLPSRVLVRLARGAAGERPSVGDVIDRLGASGPGILLMVLAVPALLPSPGLPVGFVFGAALAVVAAQMVLGRNRIALPPPLRERRLPGAFLRHGARWTARRLAGLEGVLDRRLPWLTGGAGRRVVGLAALAMAVVIMLPIPFGNAPAAAAVLLMGIGLVTRDGAALLVAYAAMAAAVVAAVWLAGAGLDAAGALLQRAAG
ncbi:exopolysaccharide biosynthesis protein [Chthonobacter albigriseus]|uniref:exopolysaccharide biosynthesis protein n=1 Tax=Chthonobacter albigriseus TaxID=1683161 RepID=UPI0015EF92DF|nr:exopolysaccharide biosynthesis protein [Chthonobacter albigriseus]